MANNKTGKDASGSTFTYKTTDTAGVDTPHINIDVVATTATSLGKAEDAAHTTGDTGVMMLAVRNDAGTALAADGDYIPLSMDADGYLRVNVAAGSSSGTEYTEGDTDSTITGTAILWEDTSDTLRAVSAANPLPTEIVSGTLSLTGEDHIGQVGGHTVVIQATPTISTSIYAALDIVGGTQTLTNAMRTSGGSGVLQTITISDDDNEKSPLLILIFNAAPSGGTYADQGALAHAAGDIDKLIGIVSIAAADYTTVVTGSLAIATKTVGLPVAAVGSANLYAIPLIASGTPTYTATSDLDFFYGFLQD